VSLTKFEKLNKGTLTSHMPEMGDIRSLSQGETWQRIGRNNERLVKVEPNVAKLDANKFLVTLQIAAKIINGGLEPLDLGPDLGDLIQHLLETHGHNRGWWLRGQLGD
jgi:hypothetical protein